MIPGSNLLNAALGLISSQQPTYFRFASNTSTPDGVEVPVYEAPVQVKRGSIQAVPRTSYEVLGLEMQKNYVNWFVAKNVLDLDRDIAGDKINWNGRQYQLVSATDWYGQDGWQQVLCVDIGAATVPA